MRTSDEYQIELFVFDSNTWEPVTMWKQMINISNCVQTNQIRTEYLVNRIFDVK